MYVLIPKWKLMPNDMHVIMNMWMKMQMHVDIYNECWDMLPF